MFSGKTSRLLDILAAAERSGRRVAVAKPIADGRLASPAIVSHDGTARDAFAFRSPEELLNAGSNLELVGLDEAQFAQPGLVSVLNELRSRGTDVASAALDLDFRGEPFQTTSILLAQALRVDRLYATCGICGNVATHTQRLSAGVPAPLTSPTVVIGGAELYEPRCERCFHAERLAAGVA
jgi:thymidine kinase